MLPIAIFSSGIPRLCEKDVIVTFTSHDFPVATLVWADAAEALRVLEPFYMLLNSTARNACRRDHFRKGYVRIAADKFHYPVGGFLTTFFLPPFLTTLRLACHQFFRRFMLHTAFEIACLISSALAASSSAVAAPSSRE